jgi:hypothetical protein
MSASDWRKRVFDIVFDKALAPLVALLISGALLVGLREKLKLPVPLWVVVVALAIGGLLGYGVSHWRNRRKPSHPTDTIRVFPRRSDWSFGYRDQKAFRDGQPTSALLHLRCEVTNITDVPVRLLDAKISFGRLRERVDSWVLTRAADGAIFGSRHYVEPGHTTEVSAEFVLTPPPKDAKEGHAIRATVLLRDQWGNSCKVKNVTFTAPARPPIGVAERVGEQLHAIQDPIEKDVAAVLKAEIDRYREAGARSQGLLGSVKSFQASGGVTAGIGSEWRRVGTADQQSLVHDIPPPAISSDNADALVALHGRLGTDAERQRFMAALMRRVDRNTEYAEVGYLIALAAFRIGQLNTVLVAAKDHLRGDDAFGFSEVLRMVDALLRLEHSTFSPELLDDVERFAEKLPLDEVMRLRERIFAIRAYRVRKG